MKRVTFPTAPPTRLTTHSPNIYKVAVKHLPSTPPYFECKPKQKLQPSPIPPPPFPVSIQSLSPDQLESAIASKFEKESSIPAPAKEAIGKTMYPRSFALSHSTAPMLDQWGRHGCPADCGKAWDKEHIVAAIKRGPHQGATSPQAIAFLQAEVADKVKSGYAKVVKWKTIKHKIPRNLKISPVALVPHKSRQYRTILDLSFKLRYKGGIIPSVNDSTKRQAPAESMVQLGNCIQRIIHTLATNYNPQHPFAFAKMDIKDGFWRMLVSEADAWNFCYVLPSPSQTSLWMMLTLWCPVPSKWAGVSPHPTSVQQPRLPGMSLKAYYTVTQSSLPIASWKKCWSKATTFTALKLLPSLSISSKCLWMIFVP